MPIWITLALTGALAQEAPATDGASEAPETSEASTEGAESTDAETAEGSESEEPEPEATEEAATTEEPEATEEEPEAAPEEPKAETTLSAELGGSYTVGNIWLVNVTGAVDFGWKKNKDAFGLHAGTNLNIVKPDADGNGTLSDAERANDPVFTSQRVEGSLRYDRSLTDADSVFALVGAEHDALAGLAWRFTEGFGYRRALVASDATALNLEVGLSYNQENFLPGTDDEGNPINEATLDAHYMAARVFLGLRHAFNDHVQLGEDLEMIEPIVGSFADGITNPEDFRLNNTLFLQAKVSDVFSIKLSSILKFDNQPVPDFVKVDHTTALTLVASIF